MFDQNTTSTTTENQLTVEPIQLANGTVRPQLLRDSVKRAVSNFFAQLDEGDTLQICFVDIIYKELRGTLTPHVNAVLRLSC